LTSLDFFLVPHLKTVEFINPIDNLQELQRVIEGATANAEFELLTDSFTNLDRQN
jgi:hypothetical protein